MGHNDKHTMVGYVAGVILTLALLAGCTPIVPEPAVNDTGTPPAPETSLHVAVLQGDLATVEQHIAAGSDLNEADAYGSTPLTIAITFGKTDVAQALIDAGADLSIGNNEGSTPLHLAAFFGRTEIVQALLDAGADRFFRNGDGATPYDLAAGPFEDDLWLYDALAQDLGPLGFTLDYEALAANRVEIAGMLRSQPAELAGVDYSPRPGSEWLVSTPEEEGLDPLLVAELYRDAAAMEMLYSLLVFKNDRLVAEDYFNGGAVGRQDLLQSVTKSFTSALVGIALEEGCLVSLDQTVLEFFPEYADAITDPRKAEITIRELLQMRAGYPWEESDPEFWSGLLAGTTPSLLVDFPLVNEPDAEFQYSNISSHLLGVIVARACGTDLLSFAREHLFGPLGIESSTWLQDPDGNYYGHAQLSLTPRDVAKLGLLYLNDGVYDGNLVVPGDWVEASLQRYSEDVSSAGIEDGRVGRYFRHVGYGYQWWSAQVGDRPFNLAWGHGGQFIILLDDLDMVLVVTSNPFFVQHDDEAWRHERANLNLVGKFIQTLADGE
jgi:CubicO group peptidase (beta-lactamase class C family)